MNIDFLQRMQAEDLSHVHVTESPYTADRVMEFMKMISFTSRENEDQMPTSPALKVWLDTGKKRLSRAGIPKHMLEENAARIAASIGNNVTQNFKKLHRKYLALSKPWIVTKQDSKDAQAQIFEKADKVFFLFFLLLTLKIQKMREQTKALHSEQKITVTEFEELEKRVCLILYAWF